MVAEVLLNGVLLQDQPEGLNDLTETIERDDSIHGYVIKYSQITLKFFGDGAVIIKDLIKTVGYESRVTCTIRLIDEAGYNDTINAYFFTTDVEYLATHNTYSVHLEDQNFGAFIKSGSKEKISVSAALSKNGVPITAPPATPITIYTPSTGSDIVTDAIVFNLIEVLESVINYLSDNTLNKSIPSNLFGNGMGLTKQYYLRTGLGDIPDNTISFVQIMDFAWKQFGILFWIDLSTSPATIRFDTENNLMSTTGDIKFTQVHGLKMTFDQELFFSSILLGSDDAIIDRNAVTYQLPFVPLIGFGEETVNTRTESTLDNQLDLKLTDFTVDTNKIENYITVGTTNPSEQHVIIEFDLGTNNATKGQYGLSGVNRLYNETLLNRNVLTRHNIPSTLVSEIGQDTDGFKAFLTGSDIAVPSVDTPMIFQDDSVNGFDTGGNYNIATGIYTIPADGTYGFKYNLFLEVTSLSTLFGNQANGVTVVASLQRNGVTIDSQSFVRLGLSGIVPFKLTDSFDHFFEAGDTVELDVSSTFNFDTGMGVNAAVLKATFTYTDQNGDSVIGGNNFLTSFVWNSGGAIVTPSTQDYPAVNLDFKYPINLIDWKELRSKPIQQVAVDTNGNNSTKAWIKSIKRKWISGESDVTLFTKLSENNII